MAPPAFLAALPLARRFGWFWAEIPGRVKARAIGAGEWSWEAGPNQAPGSAHPVQEGVPIRVFLFAPFIALVLVMVGVTICGAFYLTRTVMGRHVFAVGGNVDASRFAGLRIGRITAGVFVVSGLLAGLAAFMGASFYGSASSADATGYELYVIASAVVGGASLSGGKGSAVSAMLGAILIVLIRQSIRTLHFDQNYEWIVIGGAVILAVVLDQASARFAARRLSRSSQEVA